LVMAVLLPSIVYVIAIGFVGIYVASTIFIIAFMMWQGKFGALKSVSVAIPVNVFLFFMFEVWFTIPLPKGPLEAMFGY
jgi:putative tricarboxylic transport membrane protein